MGDNPFLEAHYEDLENKVRPSDNSFKLNLFFLDTRYRDHLEMQESRENCVQDRSIYEDLHVFVEQLHSDGTLSNKHFNEYWKRFEKVNRELRKPDLLIYLAAAPDVLRERIAKRLGEDGGREMERGLLNPENPFLENLDGRYGRMMISKYSGRTMTVDSRHYDFCDQEDFGCIRDKIEETLELKRKLVL